MSGERVYTVVYGRRPNEEKVRTPDELDAVLDKASTDAAAAGRPSVVYVLTDRGAQAPFLGLGVGREFSYLTYGGQHAPGDLDGGVPPAWYTSGARSELPAGRAVQVEAARDAAREFLLTGERPTNVEWVYSE